MGGWKQESPWKNAFLRNAPQDVGISPRASRRRRFMRFVYLAGPISGCTGPEAHDWRVNVSGQLARHFIKGVSPLRCEPLRGERYSLTYEDPRFGTARAIASKNFMDVQK